MTAALSLEEQINVLQGMGLPEHDQGYMEKAAMFHGHICPGLAMGVAASIEFLGEGRRSDDEEIVAVVENDACGTDGIQAILGCTFGKGNLIFRDHGKSVYTFFRRVTGEGMRLSVKEDLLEDLDEGSKELVIRVRSGEATEEENGAYQLLWVRRAGKVLEMRHDLFSKEEPREKLPEKARIFDSFHCTSCGERTGAHRAVEKDGRRYCIPCSKRLDR